MTWYRFVTLTCDGCGEIFDDGRSTTVDKARRSAHGEGWRSDRVTNKDWCYRCAQPLGTSAEEQADMVKGTP